VLAAVLSFVVISHGKASYFGGMETILGVRGKDWVLLAGDTKIAHSVMMLKSDTDRIVEIENHIGLAYAGEPGDDQQCVQYLSKNIVLDSMRCVQ